MRKMQSVGLLGLLFACFALCGGNAAAQDATRLLTSLRSGSALERAEAAQSLAFEKDPRIGPALTQALRDTDRFVRWRAAEALGTQEYAPATPELERLAASDPDAIVRQKASAALAMIKRTTHYAIYALRSHPDAGERQRAASSLAFALPSPEISPALISSLSDSDPKVRSAAAESLGIRKVREAVPALTELLRSSIRTDRQVASAAAEALGQIGDGRAVEALVAALRGEGLVVPTALKALALLKDSRAVAGIIELQRHDLEQHSYEVAMTLKAIGQPGLDALVTALEARPPLPVEERRAIAHAVMYSADPRIQDGVMQVLLDPDSTVRSRLASALGRMKSSKAVGLLLRLIDDTDPMVARDAVGALGFIGDRQATAPLSQLLANPSRVVLHDAAVGALGQIADLAAADALVARLNAPKMTDYDHLRAAEALCSVGGRRAKEALLASLRAGKRIVATAAHQCVIGYGEPDTSAQIAAAMNEAPSHADAFAEACMASGNAELRAAAQTWAQKHGKRISGNDPRLVRWGQGVR